MFFENVEHIQNVYITGTRIKLGQDKSNEAFFFKINHSVTRRSAAFYENMDIVDSGEQADLRQLSC